MTIGRQTARRRARAGRRAGRRGPLCSSAALEKALGRALRAFGQRRQRSWHTQLELLWTTKAPEATALQSRGAVSPVASLIAAWPCAAVAARSSTPFCCCPATNITRAQPVVSTPASRHGEIERARGRRGARRPLAASLERHRRGPRTTAGSAFEFGLWTPPQSPTAANAMQGERPPAILLRSLRCVQAACVPVLRRRRQASECDEALGCDTSRRESALYVEVLVFGAGLSEICLCSSMETTITFSPSHEGRSCSLSEHSQRCGSTVMSVVGRDIAGMLMAMHKTTCRDRLATHATLPRYRRESQGKVADGSAAGRVCCDPIRVHQAENRDADGPEAHEAKSSGRACAICLGRVSAA